jgi:chemotaxis protein CheD
MQRMVRMGEIAISNTPGEVLVSLGLGSCIGLALVDRRAGAAGLAHIVLPESSGRPNDADAAVHKFADHAVPALLDGLYELGGSRVFTRAVLVGGASMFGGAGALDVGARNADAVRSLVAGRRIPVAAEAVGGTRGRTVRVDVATGGVTVREAGGTEQALLDPAGAEVAA